MFLSSCLVLELFLKSALTSCLGKELLPGSFFIVFFGVGTKSLISFLELKLLPGYISTSCLGPNLLSGSVLASCLMM